MYLLISLLLGKFTLAQISGAMFFFMSISTARISREWAIKEFTIVDAGAIFIPCRPLISMAASPSGTLLSMVMSAIS